MLNHILCTALVLTFLAAEVHTNAENLVIKIDAGQSGMSMSPMLYGVFFEEMAFAGEGGLYPQMLRNGAFEDADTPLGWESWSRNGGTGSIRIDTSCPLCPSSPRSLQVTVDTSGEMGASNAGYWGLSIRKGLSYQCSFEAQCGDDNDRKLYAALVSESGTVLASAEVHLRSTGWQKYDVKLTAADDCESARLIISSSNPGTFRIDTVSLMPASTVQFGQSHLRPDLARAISGLHPTFLRFPGGCFIEGGKMADASRWKSTIGQMKDRRSHWTHWRYPIGNGFGFHEYLLLCEKLHVEPMFVINCGMSHTDVIPIADMEPFIQDALDAIEYCNGDVNTKWGAMRAANGHPKPFNLKYFEVGNENSGPAYEERYPLFYNAIKARYPEMNIISTAPVKSGPIDILDEHYYRMPDALARLSTLFDSYDRKGPKIYIGEYACMYIVGGANLEGALAEAAFMIGMERNSDIVTMATYAPVMGNIHMKPKDIHPLAAPAMHPVYFDDYSWFGTPSYYVQKVLSENKGDTVLPMKVPDLRKSFGHGGGIGLGTSFSDAEFADIQVSTGGKIVYESHFVDNAGWSPIKGNWKMQNGTCIGTSPEDFYCKTILPLPELENYTLRLRARKLGGSEGFAVLFRLKDADTFCRWTFGLWGNTAYGVEVVTPKGNWLLSDAVPYRIETGKWYDIRVEVTGDTVKCYLDDKFIRKFDLTVPQFHAITTRDKKSGDIIFKAVNLSEHPITAAVNLTGVSGIDQQARLTVLTGSSNAENSLAQPKAVSPKQRMIRIPGPAFDHKFAPMSLSVIRMKTKTPE